MKKSCTIAFFSLILCATAFPQDVGIIQCEPRDAKVSAWTAPGSAHLVENLLCGQSVNLVALERGFWRIKIGGKYAYVDAKYIQSAQVTNSANPPQNEQAQVPLNVESNAGPDPVPYPQTNSDRPLMRNARIFIEEMAEDLDGYIRAEMLSKKVPLTVVIKREDAHIVMTGSSTGNEKRSWHEGWLTTTRDHATGNVMIFDRASKSLLWAGEAGDRSIWWGSMARGGQRKVASRLVEKIKKAISRGEQMLNPPPPLSAEEMPAATSSATIPVNEAGSILGNNDVVKLVNAGLSDEIVISKIRSAQCNFNLETDAIIALRQAGVSNAVLVEMMQTAKK